MKKILKKNKTWLFPLAFLLMLAGGLLVWAGLKRPVTIVLNGEDTTILTSSFSIDGILSAAGIVPDEGDRIRTDPYQSSWTLDRVLVDTARKIIIRTPHDEYILQTIEAIPANILKAAAIVLYPEDQVLINGLVVDPHVPIEGHDPTLIQYHPAAALKLVVDGQRQTIYTSETTLGAALEKAEFPISQKDWISHPLSASVDQIKSVTIRRARLVNAAVDGQILMGLTAATTVGEALVDIGQPLQNLDYSIPSAESPLPESGEIEVVRVNEALNLVTDEFPYENQWVEDPNALLDTISVVDPGQMGIYATRERIRYEEGEEIWRSPEESWQASQAHDGVLGYGTRVEVRTEVVDGQEIEYWRKITVYATSYSPCRSGVEGCLYGTATGLMPVQKGAIAVTPGWLSVPNGYGMWGQYVYVQGYGHGRIVDVGGGVSGRPWIDLGYSDDDYITWGRWTTMYFLPPIPGWYPPFILP